MYVHIKKKEIPISQTNLYYMRNILKFCIYALNSYTNVHTYFDLTHKYHIQIYQHIKTHIEKTMNDVNEIFILRVFLP